jgi:hypothetical protein
MALETKVFQYVTEFEWRGGRACVAGGHAPLTDKAQRDCFISASTTAEIDVARWIVI